MKHLKFVPIALTIALVSSANTAFAQRESASRDERRQQRQQENANLSPEQRSQNFQSRMQERMKSMTPEQRQQIQERINQRLQEAGVDVNDPEAVQKAMSGMMDGQNGQGGGRGGRGGRGERAQSEAMKQMMEAAGITDFDVQDAIIAYVAEQNKARTTLFQLAQKAATALQAPVVAPINAAVTDVESTSDAKVATTFKTYENAVTAENERQEKSLKALDAKINYSGTPRIKAFLTLVGILNNDVLALGGPAAIFASPQRMGGQMGGMNAGMGMDGQQGGWNGQQGGGWNGQQQGGWNRGNQDQ